LYPSEKFHHKIIAADDSLHQNLLCYFNEAHTFIDEAINNQQCILIHCQAGISRSTTIMTSYLMKKNKISHLEAIQIVRNSRPEVMPNFMFAEQLDAFEKMNFEINEEAIHYYHIRAKLKTLVLAEKWLIKSFTNNPYFTEEHLIELSDGIFKDHLTPFTYHCAKCKRLLFSEHNIIGKLPFYDGIIDETKYCSVEPLKWISNLSKTDDLMKCPDCEEIIGEWKWKKNGKFSPLFKVDRQKIEQAATIAI